MITCLLFGHVKGRYKGSKPNTFNVRMKDVQYECLRCRRLFWTYRQGYDKK